MANTDEPAKNPNDETVKLEDEKAPATQPIMEQILSGIAALREEVVTFREEQRQLRADITAIREDLSAFRKESAANFIKLADAIQILAGEMFDRRVEVQGLRNRVEELEREAT